MSRLTLLMVLCMAMAGMTAGQTLAAEAQARVELAMKAEKEIVVSDDQGQKTLKRIAVAVLDEQGNKSTQDLEAAVVPGDEVIYTIHYLNRSPDVAAKVAITNPIPAHMNYEDGSAAGPDTRVEFSVDGRHFAAPDRLTVTLPDGRTRPAKAEDYTHVRWTLAAPLPPGKDGQVWYRAVLQ